MTSTEQSNSSASHGELIDSLAEQVVLVSSDDADDIDELYTSLTEMGDAYKADLPLCSRAAQAAADLIQGSRGNRQERLQQREYQCT